MNIINSKDLTLKNDFIEFNKNNYKAFFSTALKDRNFSRHTDDGIKELDSLKQEFCLDDLIYIRQVHSDIILDYSKSNLSVSEFNQKEGDAIIISKPNIGIGIFTADCVPVLIGCKNKKIIAAVHSGWRGTYDKISTKTIDKMIKEHNCNLQDIEVYIGPHIKKCCYEVSEELKQKFITRYNIVKNEIFEGRNLSMEKCIEHDLLEYGIEPKNIISIDICTYCSKDIPMHSYRKSSGDYKRLFSFIVLR